MVELHATVREKKRIIALVDSDVSRGGLTVTEVREQLCKADTLQSEWGFTDDGLNGTELYEALFREDPIEWNRIGAFQE